MSDSLTDGASESPEASPDVRPCAGPPLAERPAEPVSDPRGDLLRMAAVLTRTRNDRLLVEYLRLRRAAS